MLTPSSLDVSPGKSVAHESTVGSQSVVTGLTSSSSTTASPSQHPIKRRRIGDVGSSLSNVMNSFLMDPSFDLSSCQIPLSPYAYSSSSSLPSTTSSDLFSLLSEDLLVCICEYFNMYELARLDQVCRSFRLLLNLPNDATTMSTSMNDPSSLHAHSANYLWRKAALQPNAWPFPKYIDREHLERVVLKHLQSKLPTADNGDNDETDALRRENDRTEADTG